MPKVTSKVIGGFSDRCLQESKYYNQVVIVALSEFVERFHSMTIPGSLARDCVKSGLTYNVIRKKCDALKSSNEFSRVKQVLALFSESYLAILPAMTGTPSQYSFQFGSFPDIVTALNGIDDFETTVKTAAYDHKIILSEFQFEKCQVRNLFSKNWFRLIPIV